MTVANGALLRAAVERLQDEFFNGASESGTHESIEGGPTNFENRVRLDTRHHRQKTHHGYRVMTQAGGSSCGESGIKVSLVRSLARSGEHHQISEILDEESHCIRPVKMKLAEKIQK